MKIKTLLPLFFIFLFLAVQATGGIAQPDFSISSTTSFDAGVKSNSSDVFEVETRTDNPSVPEGVLQLASRKGYGFTFEDNDSITWKSEGADENKNSIRKIRNDVLFLNSTGRNKKTSVKINATVEGNFSATASVANWSYYNPYGEENESGGSCENPEKKVSPVLECVQHNDNGTYTAYFGYDNKNNCTVGIEVGPNNKFAGQGTEDKGQPETFSSGRVKGNFSVNFERGALVWFLRSPNGKATTATASKNPNQKCSGNESFLEKEGTFSKIFSFSRSLSQVRVSAFIPIQIIPGPPTSEDADYSNSLVFKASERKYAYVLSNMTHVTFGVKKWLQSSKSSTRIYPDEISGNDELFFKLVRYDTDSFAGYYKVENSSWKLIGNQTDTGIDEKGNAHLFYRSPTKAPGPGVRFSNYEFKDAEFSNPESIYRKEGIWLSEEKEVEEGMKLRSTTIEYSGDYNNYISKIEWLNASSGKILAEYVYDLVEGNRTIIDSGDLSAGSFDNVTSNFRIRVKMKGNGSSTPVLKEISGKYRAINTPPAVQVESKNNTVTHSKNISVSFKVVDLEQNLVNSTLFIDGEKKETLRDISNASSVSISGNVNKIGEHWYQVESTDGDLTGASKKHKFKVVNEKPTVHLITKNNTAVSERSPEIFFNITDPENKTLSAELFVDNTSTTSDETLPRNSKVSLFPGNLTIGTHEFWVNASDSIYWNASDKYEITVCSIPEISLNMENNTTTHLTSLSTNFTLTDKDNINHSVSLFLDGKNVSFRKPVENNTEINFTLENLTPGRHWYWFRVKDERLKYTFKNYTLNVLNDAPTVEIMTSNETSFNNSSLLIEFVANDNEQENLSATLYINNESVAKNDSITNGTASSFHLKNVNLSDGNHTYRIEASDGTTLNTTTLHSFSIRSETEEDQDQSDSDSGSQATGGSGGGGGSVGSVASTPSDNTTDEGNESEPLENQSSVNESREGTEAEEQNNSGAEEINETTSSPTGLFTFASSAYASVILSILGFGALISVWYFVRVKNKY